MQTNIQIINYVDICSNALLSLLDNDDYILKKTDDVYEIELNNNIKKTIIYYIESYCNNNYQYGKYNIIVNTCRPMDNFRKIERGAALKSVKYTITEPYSFNIDKTQLEKLLDKCWKSYSKKLDKFIWITHENLDIFDIICIIRDLLEPNPITVNPTHYFFIKDYNNEYVHFEKIPSKYKTDIEILLRNSKIII